MHTAVLEPNVEPILSPDAGHVSVTAHGIAAVREIVVPSDGYNGSQMSFSRMFSPSDLIDRTWLLSFPVEVEYTAVKDAPEDQDYLENDLNKLRRWKGTHALSDFEVRMNGMLVKPDDLVVNGTTFSAAAKEMPNGLPADAAGDVMVGTSVHPVKTKIDVLRNMMMAKKLGVDGSKGDVVVAPNAFSRMTTHCTLTLNNGTLTSQPYLENLPQAYYNDPDEIRMNDGLDRPFTSTVPFLAGEGVLALSSDAANQLQAHTIASYPLTGEDAGASATPPSGVSVERVEVTCSNAQVVGDKHLLPGRNPSTVVHSLGAEQLITQKTVGGEHVSFALQDVANRIPVTEGGSGPCTSPFSVTGTKVNKIKVTYEITVPVDHPLLQSTAGDQCLCNIRNMDLKINYKDLLKCLYLPRQADFKIGGETFRGYPSFTSNRVLDVTSLERPVFDKGKTTQDTKSFTSSLWGMTKEELTDSADGTVGRPYPWEAYPSYTAGEVSSPYAGAQVLPYSVVANIPANADNRARLRLRLYQSAVPVPRSISVPTNTYIVRQTKNAAIRNVSHPINLSASMFGTSADGISEGVNSLSGMELAQPIATNWNSQFTFQTDSYSLSEVPLRMYIFVAGQNLDGESSTGQPVLGDAFSQPDKLLRITEMNFRTTANTGTLSTATQRQLYEMCKRNGLNIPLEQFLYDGNVVCVRPSRDLGGWVEGSRETFTHDFKVVADVPGSTPDSFEALLRRMRQARTPSGSASTSYDAFSGGGTSDLKALLANELAVLRNSIRDPTCYVVYEMAGQCMLQADGQMMTTSGIDTSTIVGTLGGQGLSMGGGGIDIKGGGFSFGRVGRWLSKTHTHLASIKQHVEKGHQGAEEGH